MTFVQFSALFTLPKIKFLFPITPSKSDAIIFLAGE